MTRFDSYKDEEQNKTNVRARVWMWVLFLIFSLALIWLSFKVSRQMHTIRSNFGTYIKRWLVGGLILTILFILIFVVLNSIGKKKSYDKHYVENDEK